MEFNLHRVPRKVREIFEKKRERMEAVVKNFLVENSFFSLFRE